MIGFFKTDNRIYNPPPLCFSGQKDYRESGKKQFLFFLSIFIFLIVVDKRAGGEGLRTEKEG